MDFELRISDLIRNHQFAIRNAVMLWFRMGQVAFRVAWPFVFSPWRSPLVRWRIETYGFTDPSGQLLHAADMTLAQFLRFTLRNRHALARFLRWAALL